ncbi:MAG: phosphatidylglycerophosphatase A [Nitrospirota bacterium]|nr:phosphatidylglycerophosphatase A [Nitrospirota bacterium]
MKKDDIFKFIATLGPLGYSPVAPGTVGSALSCLTYIFFRPDVMALSIIIPVGFVAGVLVSDRTEKLLNEKDSSHIVVDEFVGYLVSVFLVPFSIPNAILAFFLFRAFDILKPTPIRQLERRIPGGLGIMIDDILAGVYANLVLRLILVIILKIGVME